MDAATLRTQLAIRLPAYMIPSGFTFLDRLPLGATGKIDRNGLVAPSLDAVTNARDRIPPVTDTERKLTQAWEHILQTSGIGTNDAFFDIGGHSLLALSLIHDVNEVFGLNLPVRFVINEPTIARQAAVIDQLRLYTPVERTKYPLIVPIRAHGRRTPFFLVAGGFGGEAELLVYAKLADYLDPDQPFYGMRIRGIDDLEEPARSVEAIAAEHIAEIRKVQPRGPYMIGGSCVGGIVAFEVAQQLKRRGEQIGLLVLIDSRFPSWRWYARYVVNSALRDLREGNFGKLMGGPFKTSDDQTIEREKFRIGRIYLRRTLQYEPEPFDGNITFIVCENQRDRDMTRGWKILARGGLTMRYVPGDHYTHLRQHAAETGRELNDCLRIASSALRSNHSMRDDAIQAAIEVMYL